MKPGGINVKLLFLRLFIPQDPRTAPVAEGSHKEPSPAWVVELSPLSSLVLLPLSPPVEVELLVAVSSCSCPTAGRAVVSGRVQEKE